MADYPAILTRTPQGGFVLRIPALSLVVERPTLEEAWAAIEAEKTALIERHRRVGAEVPASGGTVDAAVDTGLRRFAVKAAIVALGVSIIIAATAISFTYAVREPLRMSGLKLGRAAIAQLETGLRQAAAELTPEKREALRQMVADAAPALKSYVRELRPLLAEACSETAGQP